MKKKYTPKRRNTMPIEQQQWLTYLAVRLSKATGTKKGVLLPHVRPKPGSVWEYIDFHFNAFELADLGSRLRAIAKGKDARIVFGQAPGSGRRAGSTKNEERLGMYNRLLKGGTRPFAAQRKVVAAMPGIKPETLRKYIRDWKRLHGSLPEEADPNEDFPSLD